MSRRGSMEDEPHRSAPVPSPHPSCGLEASSALLNLTPEKPKRRRQGRRPVQLKQHDCQNYHSNTIKVAHNVDCVTSDDRVVCAELAVPRVNTTAPLYHQLQQYTQTSNRGRSAEYKLEDGRLEDQQERECGENSLPQEGTYTTTSNSSPATTRAAESESSKKDICPDGGGRYTDLVAVDVSEESFQRLTTCPRSKRTHTTRGGRGKRGSTPTTPNIMDFFLEDFVVEDIGVDQVLPTASQPPELFVPSCDDALALYHFVNRT